MTEVELAQKFIEHFDGFNIYPEVPVPYGGVCDLVIKAGKLLTAIEVKKCFNICVINQGLRNKKHAHYSYIAVPILERGGRNVDGETLCKELGIGVLYYYKQEVSLCTLRGDYKYTHVLEQVKPVYGRPIRSFKLEEWMKQSEAGSQGNRMTAFKASVQEMATHIKNKGGKVPVRDFFKNNKFHYASPSSAVHSIISLCESKAIKLFRHEAGFLIIDDESEITNQVSKIDTF